MNKLLCLLHLIFLVEVQQAFAQKEYNVWYFSEFGGLTFNTNPPQALSDGKLCGFESSSSMCDKNGNLLFYTSGDTIWNRYHQLMKNHFPPVSHFNASSVQGSIVIPKPGSDSLYYIFTTNGSEAGLDSLRYSVINMKGDNGKGEVIVWQKGLLPNPGEGMALTRHANKKDIWIGTVDRLTGYFKCVRTIDGEISDSIVSSFANISPYATAGRFSPNGKILFLNPGYTQPEGMYFTLFHFNNATGQLSDKLKITTRNYTYIGGEFSHDSRYFYFTNHDNMVENDIVQYDLVQWDQNRVKESETQVYVSLSMANIAGFQLGPDKKIYVFREQKDHLAVIDYPERKGTACEVIENGPGLKGCQLGYGSPYYPTFNFLKPYVELGPDTLLCNGDSLVLDPGGSDYTHIRWSTGDTTPVIVVRKSGKYYVTVMNEIDTVMDSVQVTVRNRFPVFLGNDTAFCGAFSHVLNAGNYVKNYRWSTGDTTVSILVDRPGVYAVTIKDSNSCIAGDTILIDQLTVPFIAVKHIPLDCQYIFLDASPRQNGASYLWSTGDTSMIIKVQEKGRYDLVIRNLFCRMSGFVEVNELGPGCDLIYYIPNAFTPGNDGVNETFKVTGINIDKVEMQIYDRWGQKIYEGSEWDGTSNGKPCRQDTYIYRITITGYQNGRLLSENGSGNITLMR